MGLLSFPIMPMNDKSILFLQFLNRRIKHGITRRPNEELETKERGKNKYATGVIKYKRRYTSC